MHDIKHIVIVDDHAMFRKGLAVLLNSFAGYKVLFGASSGKDLINQLDANNLPDIILLDINMPEMDGYETAEWLQANYPAIKILALSTMDSESAVLKMVKKGAKGYLLKDIEPHELKHALDEVCLQDYFYNSLVTPELVRSIH